MRVGAGGGGATGSGDSLPGLARLSPEVAAANGDEVIGLEPIARLGAETEAGSAAPNVADVVPVPAMDADPAEEVAGVLDVKGGADRKGG